MTHLTVTVLGSGTCVPSATRYPSSYFIKPSAVSGGWLIDLGPGALQRLAMAGADYREIDRVYISHTHPDHISGLMPLLQALNYTPGFRRTKPLFLYGSQEVRYFLECQWKLEAGLHPNFPMQFIQLEDGQKVAVENGYVLSKCMAHAPGTLGFRFSIGGCALVYGADTGPCKEIVDLAREADLVILESSFCCNHPSPTHLTICQAGEIARRARAKRLLLSHFYPEVLEMSEKERKARVRESGYQGELVLAEDLLVVEVCG